jgi:hypothetical protein
MFLGSWSFHINITSFDEGDHVIVNKREKFLRIWVTIYKKTSELQSGGFSTI